MSPSTAINGQVRRHRQGCGPDWGTAREDGEGAREAAGEHALAGEIITLGKIVHGGLAEGEEGCGGPHRGLPAGRWLCTAGTGGTGGLDDQGRGLR